MKIKKLMKEIHDKFTELDVEMETLGFHWTVDRRGFDKAFGDIDIEIKRRHLTSAIHADGEKRCSECGWPVTEHRYNCSHSPY